MVSFMAFHIIVALILVMGWVFCSSSGWWETYGVFVGCNWQGNNQILVENPSQCHFAFHHKSHAHCPRIKPRHAWWETGKLTAWAMTRPSVMLYWEGTGVEYLGFFQSICKWMRVLVLSRRDFRIYHLTYASRLSEGFVRRRCSRIVMP